MKENKNVKENVKKRKDGGEGVDKGGRKEECEE
jgi:hypothetical protein